MSFSHQSLSQSIYRVIPSSQHNPIQEVFLNLTCHLVIAFPGRTAHVSGLVWPSLSDCGLSFNDL